MPEMEQPLPKSKAARFNEILNILIRNDAWALARAVLAGRGSAANGDAHGTPDAPARLRRVLEELGPTFIKLGQLLATRPDLVPDPYVAEFKKLYDTTTPTPFAQAKQVLETELQRPLEAVFSKFEPTPIASASVGQVHRATLLDGTLVAVKVQHPGIEDAMRTDFEILRGLVTFVEKTFARSRVWQPSDHLEELRGMLERELDYRYELRSMQRVAHNFRHEPSVKVPRDFPEHCTQRVLVMEFIEGIKFTRADGPELKAIDRKKIARIVTHAMAKQIFGHRFFHADPSPGNMMIVNGDQVAFLDFGAMGIVTARRSKAILRLITSISKGDVDDAAEAIVDLCDQRGEHDAKRFVSDVERVLDFFEREGVSVADPRLMEMIIHLAKAHRMLLPPDFMLITRALFQFDGFCRELDPDYDLVAILEPLVGELVWKTVASPSRQKEIVEETLGEMLRFARTFPHTLNRLVRRIERNEISTRVELVGLEGLKQAQGRSALKVGFTIVAAAIILGLAVVFAAPDPAGRVGPFLFVSGIVVALWALVLVLWSEGFKGRHG